MHGTCSLPVDTKVPRPALRIVQYWCSQADFYGTLHNSVQICQHTQQAGDLGFITSAQIQTVSPFNNNKELFNQISTVHCISKTQFRCILTVVEYHTLSLHFDLKNGFHPAGPNSFKAVTLFIPISKTLATTSTPKFLTGD